MNTYSCSDGTRVTQSQIDSRVRKAKGEVIKSQFDQYGYNFCEECGHNGSGTRLDCSHDYSVGKSKSEGKTEQSWNIKNIIIRCRKCHQEKDGLGLKLKL